MSAPALSVTSMHSYAPTYDALRDHLDALPFAQVAQRLGIQLLRSGAPRVCPRHECRSDSPFASTDADGTFWCCPVCGIAGGGAALLVASVAGWQSTEPEDAAQLERDTPRLLLEAGCAGLIDVEDPRWQAFYEAFPRALDLERGVYEGDDRAGQVRRLAERLIRSRMPGASVMRIAFAFSAAYCRPALRADELAAALNAAALEAAA